MRAESTRRRPSAQAMLREYLFMGQGLGQYLRSLVTPWNALAAVILGIGIPVAILRFTYGLAATTNLSDDNPWGLWIGVDVLAGVALAAGGYTMAGAFHVLGLKEYRPLVRPAVLTASWATCSWSWACSSTWAVPGACPTPCLSPWGLPR